MPAPPKPLPRRARAVIVGRLLGVMCHLIGWFAPMYGAGRLESRNIREYETALQLGDDDINIRAYLCNQYWAVNRYRDADTCLKHVLHLDPHNNSALYIYPYVLMSLEQGERER